MSRIFKLIAIFIAIAFLFSLVPALLASHAAGSDGLAEGGNPSAKVSGTSRNSIDKMSKAIVLYIGSPVAYVKGSEASIDPSDPEVAPVVKDGARMVPLRFIAESLGAKVDWDQRSRTATVVLGLKAYKFTQGSNILRVGKSEHTMDAPVQAVKGRTFVPLEKFVQVLGRKAFYDRGLIMISGSGDAFDPVSDKDLISDLISRMSYLPVVGSYEKLQELLKEFEQNRIYVFGGRNGMKARAGAATAVDEAVVADTGSQVMKSAERAAANVQSEAAFEASDSAGSADYSTTNVQVQGVDEADIVKTDGQYIYQVNRQRVVVTRVYPAQDMKVLSTLTFKDSSFQPLELYLHGPGLVVIGTTQGRIPRLESKSSADGKIYPPPEYYQPITKALVFDISNKEKIKQIREIELEGNYVSSRKIGSSLYLVANRYVDYYRIMKDEALENATPSYRDTLEKDGYVNIGYDKIHYFPGICEPNYMLVAGVDLDGGQAADISTYLGAGQNIYASTENLYVAVTGYRTGEVKPLEEAADPQASALKAKPDMMPPAPGIIPPRPVYEENTLIYKFGLKDGKTTYLCKGEVPGRILNQFSMDENKGYFRIAATKGDMWRTDEGISKNNLYVLDDVLSITGKVEDIAPGERIYSVRFMGDRAYMVTFKTVDPLFVLDLRDPAKPSILGALKIPGYSDYLHPYDENHIIGFGKDTVEMKGQAYYLGMKIALFDVSDVSNPVQKFSETIGDRGTDSELLRNHKALLFSKERNLLAFPVTLMEVKGMSDLMKRESLQYGQFTFQGAYIYSLDAANGFKLRGRVTHLSQEDYQKAGGGWYESSLNVQRILYIGDTLYTLSEGMLKANGMNDLKEINSIVIP